MIDNFALLDQPRKPWVDPEELKETFHAKSRQLHPDVSDTSDNAFAQLNEAYQVLRDPKRRIHHLLELEGRTPARHSTIPDDVAELFPIVAAVTHDAAELLQKMNLATNPLSRSLLQAPLIEVQKRVTETLQRLTVIAEEGNGRLQLLNLGNFADDQIRSQLEELYLRFSYVGRWIAELEEKQLQLT